MRIAIALFLHLLLGAAAYAQTDTATLTVTVFDSSAAAVPGATVVVTNLHTSTVRELVSDTAGRASFRCCRRVNTR